MKEVIVPRVLPAEEKTVKEYITVLESSFSKVTTEWKFDKELKNADLMVPFEQCILSAGRVSEK